MGFMTFFQLSTSDVMQFMPTLPEDTAIQIGSRRGRHCERECGLVQEIEQVTMSVTLPHLLLQFSGLHSHSGCSGFAAERTVLQVRTGNTSQQHILTLSVLEVSRTIRGTVYVRTYVHTCTYIGHHLWINRNG